MIQAIKDIWASLVETNYELYEVVNDLPEKKLIFDYQEELSTLIINDS